jgi:phosphatidylglycerol lysyltransferase
LIEPGNKPGVFYGSLVLMHPHIPVRDLWWLAAGGGASYTARYVTHKVRMVRAFAHRFRVVDPTSELLRLQSLYGYNAHSLVSITPGASTWTTPGIEGVIIYGEFGRVWLAAGDPLSRPEDIKPLVKSFLAAASKARRIAAFVPATERFAHEAARLGMSAIKIGAAPYFDLRVWQPRGNKAKNLRAGVNKASRAGVRVESVESLTDELKKKTAELCLNWLKARRAATSFGWLLALDPFLRADRKKLFAAYDVKNRLVGLLAASPIPARDGWYLEDVLRAEDAPQGTADLLVFKALQQLKQEGAAMATLGTAPLANEGVDEISTHDHPVIERALRLAAKRLRRFYNFEGLRRFKSKFVANWWESEYALVQHGVLVPSRVAHALLRAIVPGGLKQFLARQTIRSVRR